MRFLVDECTGPGLAQWLRTQGHDVFSVYEESRGATDEMIIEKAFNENRILITNDKDFGETVYREKHPHCGVIFLRLSNNRAPGKIAVLSRLLQNYADKLPDRFVVVTETRVRFGRKYSGLLMRATCARDSTGSGSDLVPPRVRLQRHQVATAPCTVPGARN